MIQLIEEIDRIKTSLKHIQKLFFLQEVRIDIVIDIFYSSMDSMLESKWKCKSIDLQDGRFLYSLLHFFSESPYDHRYSMLVISIGIWRPLTGHSLQIPRQKIFSISLMFLEAEYSVTSIFRRIIEHDIVTYHIHSFDTMAEIFTLLNTLIEIFTLSNPMAEIFTCRPLRNN